MQDTIWGWLKILDPPRLDVLHRKDTHLRVSLVRHVRSMGRKGVVTRFPGLDAERICWKPFDCKIAKKIWSWFSLNEINEQVDGLAEDVGGTIPGLDITGAGALVRNLLGLMGSWWGYNGDTACLNPMIHLAVLCLSWYMCIWGQSGITFAGSVDMCMSVHCKPCIW